MEAVGSKSCSDWPKMKNATSAGVINIPIRLEKEAQQTAPATLPLATEVKAIDDWTVDGKKHINRKPQYNSCPSIGCKIGLANNPKRGNKAKVKAKTRVCSLQCIIPSTTASRESLAPCRKNRIAIAAVVTQPNTWAACPETGSKLASNIITNNNIVKRSNAKSLSI